MAFLVISAFYLYFTIPLLKPVPEDKASSQNEIKENLSYSEFIRNPKFLCTNMS